MWNYLAISQRCFKLIFFDLKDDMLQCPCSFIVYKGFQVLTESSYFLSIIFLRILLRYCKLYTGLKANFFSFLLI